MFIGPILLLPVKLLAALAMYLKQKLSSPKAEERSKGPSQLPSYTNI